MGAHHRVTGDETPPPELPAAFGDANANSAPPEFVKFQSFEYHIACITVQLNVFPKLAVMTTCSLLQRNATRKFSKSTEISNFIRRIIIHSSYLQLAILLWQRVLECMRVGLGAVVPEF